MKISFDSGENASITIILCGSKSDAFMVCNTIPALSSEIIEKLQNAAKLANFKGAAGSSLVLHALIEGYDTIVLAGIGDIDTPNSQAFEKAAASAIKAVLTMGPQNAKILCADFGDKTDELMAAAAMGVKLAAYRFDKYRTQLKEDKKPKLESVAIDCANAAPLFTALEAIAEGVYFARDLMNEPPNVLTTTEFAIRLQELSGLGVEVEVVDEKQMAELKMFSFLGVGQGSVNPPKLVIMKYNGGTNEAPLALIGKGLCFDSGGISIKPSGGMEDMKGDMGGGAAVAGAMKAIAGRKAKLNVVGLIGLAENMPDAGAQRPGDIVTSMSGQTIEVLNTDAEGRLVLCDVITYAQEKFAPQYMIDLATLTGAIVISLGAEYAGLFSNDDELSEKLSVAGNISGEKVWRFPMSPAYDKLLDSNIADMKNVQRSGPGAGAGSITAAQFLARFVNPQTKWAHIDIAGTAWQGASEDPRSPSWGTGFGVRLLDELVRSHFEK